VIGELGHDADGYKKYLSRDGLRDLESCIEEGHADQVFGVPIFVFRGEQFWGHDRIGLLEERLTEAGLRRALSEGQE
jgi:2-hydroxychromene-2-carboxylate isomerase